MCITEIELVSEESVMNLSTSNSRNNMTMAQELVAWLFRTKVFDDNWEDS